MPSHNTSILAENKMIKRSRLASVEKIRILRLVGVPGSGPNLVPSGGPRSANPVGQ